jgi:hypothetical protein
MVLPTTSVLLPSQGADAGRTRFHTHPVVVHPYHGLLTLPLDAQPDETALLGELAGVVEEIAHHLNQSERIDVHPHGQQQKHLRGSAIVPGKIKFEWAYPRSSREPQPRFIPLRHCLSGYRLKAGESSSRRTLQGR